MLSGANAFLNLEELYDKIYRYCYFRVRQKEQAEDLTQEAFLRFFASSSYREKGQSLQYLYSIARNLCIDEYRKRPVAPFTESTQAYLHKTDPSPSMEEQLTTSLALKEAVGKLSREEQELLLLRYVNEVPVGVICRLLGISRFALYRKTAGALKKLKCLLVKEEFL